MDSPAVCVNKVLLGFQQVRMRGRVFWGEKIAWENTGRDVEMTYETFKSDN